MEVQDVTCPHCEVSLEMSADLIGKSIECPSCFLEFKIAPEKKKKVIKKRKEEDDENSIAFINPESLGVNIFGIVRGELFAYVGKKKNLKDYQEALKRKSLKAVFHDGYQVVPIDRITKIELHEDGVKPVIAVQGQAEDENLIMLFKSVRDKAIFVDFFLKLTGDAFLPVKAKKNIHELDQRPLLGVTLFPITLTFLAYVSTIVKPEDLQAKQVWTEWFYKFLQSIGASGFLLSAIPLTAFFGIWTFKAFSNNDKMIIIPNPDFTDEQILEARQEFMESNYEIEDEEAQYVENNETVVLRDPQQFYEMQEFYEQAAQDVEDALSPDAPFEGEEE